MDNRVFKSDPDGLKKIYESANQPQRVGLLQNYWQKFKGLFHGNEEETDQP